MAVKLYVGNLPYNTQDSDLKELFQEFGEIESVRLITDRETGRSKGFAFVEFSTKEAADAAINGLNGKDYGGRGLVVNEARPVSERPPRRDDHNGGGDRGGFSSFRKRSW